MTATQNPPPDPDPIETRLAALLDALDVGVVRVSQDGIVLEANDAFLRIVRAERDGAPIVGTSVAALLAPGSDWPSTLDAVRAAGAASPPRSVEAGLLRRDGTVARVSGVGREVVGNGTPVVEGIVRDVSAEHGLREEVLEVGMRERERLASTLHDDLGPLLTSLSLTAQTLGSHLPGDVGAEARWRVGRIQSLAQEAATRVRLLAHASHDEPSDAMDLVDALQRMTTRWEELFDVRARLRSSPAAIHLPAGDAQHVFYVAQEAVTNAVRHGGARGVDVSLDMRGGVVTLSVRDDGAGLAVDRLEGLGTRLMRHRSRLLGGSLEVAGDPAGGTRMTLRFPCHPAHAGEPP